MAFSKSKLVKEIAREKIGPVPPTKVIPGKKKDKHPKRTLEQESE